MDFLQVFVIVQNDASLLLFYIYILKVTVYELSYISDLKKVDIFMIAN